VTIKDLTFHLEFMRPRNDEFPLDELFGRIHQELEAGRFVIIGLASGGGWHNWVIYDEAADGEFLAVSKFGSKTIHRRDVKETVRKMKGTDIGTYTLLSART
jgi:hypothetical protein